VTGNPPPSAPASTLSAEHVARDTGVSRVALLRDPVLMGIVGAGTATALHFHDPHVRGSWGFCPFLLLTGHPCPGCGGLRAINDLTNGDVVGAISSNALAVALAAVLGLAWMVWIVRRLRGDAQSRWFTLSPPVVFGLLVVMGVFEVVRLTPWGAWLRP
jgi:hypothetical protein